MRTDTPVPVKLSAYAPYPFEIESVTMRFDLDFDTTCVESTLKVKRLDIGDMVLDGVGLVLRSIAIDGHALSEGAYTVSEETLTIHDTPEQFELTIVVENQPRKNSALSGLYVSGGRLCTQCEADGFRRITYWPDRPDVMSRFEVRLEGDKSAFPFLLANGTPGNFGDIDAGRHFAEWDDPHPKPSYLFALCAGNYDVYRDQFTTMGGRHVDLAIHVDKGDADRAAYAMDSLKRSMKWDEDCFGREYDLGVFNIVAVRDFNFGAMENKGLNVFNSAYVLADEASATDMDFEAIESIVAHEYFHNWTGNRITCRDWFQLCLKEGLTVFRDQEFSADMRARAVQRIKDVIRLRARQFAEDGGPLAHAVRPDQYASVDNLYTATVYEKGAELIRMLKTLLGEDVFAAGMDLYFERFDGHAATIEDFYSCFSEVSGRDLTHFMAWYGQPGTPTVKVTHSFDPATGKGKVDFTQSNPTTRVQPAPKPLPIPLKWSLPEAGKAEEVFLLEGEADSISYTVNPNGTRPLLSVNRGFSAPIHLETDHSDEERLNLVRKDTDPFNRWDALQTLLQRELMALAYDGAAAPKASIISAMCAAARSTAQDDPAFAALLLGVPSPIELFQVRTPADPAALAKARKALRSGLIARPEMADFAYGLLEAPAPTPFTPSADQAGIRALRSAAISLLGAANTNVSEKKLEDLFRGATNMTEKLACLRAIGERHGPDAAAFSTFHTAYQDQPLVIDKWFQVAAISAASASHLKSYLAHPDFNLTNPNRVRSLAGVFAMQNLAAFHADDGSGYALIEDIVSRLDRSNPAVAARLITAFEQWRSLEPLARSQAEALLQRLSESDLSKNARDIVSRALANNDENA
ncbi:MAG: aminopeptidase N [Pseudomonadota bacterium]